VPYDVADAVPHDDTGYEKVKVVMITVKSRVRVGCKIPRVFPISLFPAAEIETKKEPAQ
jgi:hypothetical protein